MGTMIINIHQLCTKNIQKSNSKQTLHLLRISPMMKPEMTDSTAIVVRVRTDFVGRLKAGTVGNVRHFHPVSGLVPNDSEKQYTIWLFNIAMENQNF
jgi:hypothetical protein